MYKFKSASIQTNSVIREFLDDLYFLTEISFTVTSAIRTPRQQAQAVYNKIQLGDDITKIYNYAYAQAMKLAYPNIDAMTSIVQSMDSTPHVKGRGVDIRTTNLTPDQIARIRKACTDLGCKTLLETTPPHLHITIPDTYLSFKANTTDKTDTTDTTEKKTLNIGLILGAIWIFKKLLK